MNRPLEQPNDLTGRPGDAVGRPDANIPAPSSERGAWAVAIALGLLGAGVLALVLSGVVGRVGAAGGNGSAAIPAIVPAPTPAAPSPLGHETATTPGSSPLRGRASAIAVRVAGRPGAHRHAIVGDPTPIQARRDLALYEAPTSTHISDAWMQGFYPIYATAQRTFGVNWLLIASIHKQESDFSTAPSTYRGLNFAGCCGGPMQFNVTNGPVTTWALVSNSYVYGSRPSTYDHMTATHPSIYDDFDAIMAAAHLLSADGAEMQLNGAAWDAAYDYYGHDLTGVTYADQVLARAIGWSQHGFCINCELEPPMVSAVNAAYGAPVAATYETATVARSKPRKRRKR